MGTDAVEGKRLITGQAVIILADCHRADGPSVGPRWGFWEVHLPVWQNFLLVDLSPVVSALKFVLFFAPITHCTLHGRWLRATVGKLPEHAAHHRWIPVLHFPPQLW